MVGGGHLRFRKDGVAEYIIGDMKTMRALLKAVKPYLVLKKSQADLMIEILDKKAEVKSKEDFLLLATLVDRFKDLNYSKNRKNNLIAVVNRLKS